MAMAFSSLTRKEVSRLRQSPGFKLLGGCCFYQPRQAAPQVLSVNPAPGAAGVITGVAPTASFSEPLDPTSLTGDNVQMFDTGNIPVPVNVSYDLSNFTITITPKAPLLPSNAYVVSLGGITDSTGTPLATGYTWAFSTEAAIPPGPPLSIFGRTGTLRSTLYLMTRPQRKSD